MTVDNIKNILKMVEEIMETIAKYFPVELNKQLIDMLEKMSQETTTYPELKLFFDAKKTDYDGALKVLKGLDSLYKESEDIADFAKRMQERKIVLKLLSVIV